LTVMTVTVVLVVEVAAAKDVKTGV